MNSINNIPGFNAEITLHKTIQRDYFNHKYIDIKQGGVSVEPQFAIGFFLWCVWTFGEWSACWYASGD